MEPRKIETLTLGKSGRIEKFFGKRFRTDYDSSPVKILIWVMLVAYIPLLVMGGFDGTLWEGKVDIPFFFDYKTQFRALIAIPLLIIGRRAVNDKLNQTFGYVADKLVDEEHFKSVFAPAIKRIEYINEKGYDELVIVLVLVIYSLVQGSHNIERLSNSNLSGWFGRDIGEDVDLSMMAKWHLFISMNIYRFIIVRWIWTYGCWLWILFKISRCKLVLSIYHADKVCGLNRLMFPQRVFNMFFIALALISSGDLINNIMYFNESFELVKMDMGVVVAASFFFLLAPYLLFTGMLNAAKDKAELDLGRRSIELSKGYQNQFIDGTPAGENEEHVDSSAIADFDAVYAKGTGIRPVPFSIGDVIALAIPIVLAFVPTLLTFMTLKELLSIVLGFL